MTFLWRLIKRQNGSERDVVGIAEDEEDRTTHERMRVKENRASLMEAMNREALNIIDRPRQAPYQTSFVDAQIEAIRRGVEENASRNYRR